MKKSQEFIEAKKNIDRYFNLHTEAYSIWQEVTDNGVFNKSHVQEFDEETLINVGQDLDAQIEIELYN